MSLFTENDGYEEEGAKPFLSHLEDLRDMLVRSVGVMALGMLVAVFFVPQIMALIKAPLVAAGQDPETFLLQLKVTGGFSIAMRIIFWSGLLFASPLIVYFVAWFIFPGLHANEKKAVVRSSGFSVALFILGVCQGYFISLPVALKVMFWFNEWVGVSGEKVLALDYVGFVLKLLIGFGLAFELPVVLYVLGCLGIVNARQLRERRRHVAVGLLVLAMMLTPPDVFTQLILATPLYLFFEITTVLIALREKRQGKEKDDVAVVD